MNLPVGTRLGPYQILAPLGSGGMGEVYRARDTRLNRTVAIKTLPKHLAHNSEFRQRFDREARTLSSISHPNICTLFDIGEYDGLNFLVIEYLEGETLATRLSRGQLSVPELLQLGIHMADALAKAHQQGIIHRDLKPTNIMLTRQGTKLLDFGLARDLSTAVAVGASSCGETGTYAGPLTSAGIVIGTFRYMSPEQLRCSPADARSDIFTFGAVLYEAATGKAAFGGDSPALSITAALEKEPPSLRDLRRDVPESVQSVIQRCLRKDPDQRWQCAADILIELRQIADAPERRRSKPVGAGSPVLAATSKWLLSAAVATLAVTLAVLGWERHKLFSHTVGPTVVQVSRITHDPGRSEWPAWSPDGTLLAFASNRSGNFEIYVRRLSGGQEINVSNDPGDDFQPAFSPDGNSIAFVSTRSSRTSMTRFGGTWGWDFGAFGGDVWVTPTLGGHAQRVAEDGNAPAWHPNGRTIAYISGPEGHRSVLTVDAQGSRPIALLPSKSSQWEIVRLHYSPDGAWITFETIDNQILSLPAEGGSPHFLFSGTSHTWDPASGQIYFLTRDLQGGTRLMSVRVDPHTCDLRNEPHVVAVLTAVLRDLAVSKDRSSLAVSESNESLNLTRLPMNSDASAPAGQEEALSSGQVNDHFPAYSPDGDRIAFASNRLGAEEIWIQDLHSTQRARLQLPGKGLGANLPLWFPDGKQLVVTRFYSDGKRALWVASIDGSRAVELVPPINGLLGNDVSADGQTVLYAAKAGTYSQLFSIDVATRSQRQLTVSAGDKYSAAWSRDGRWILFNSNSAGSIQLWRVSSNGGEEERLTSGTGRIRHAFYSRDGRWIYLQPDHKNIYRMQSTGGPQEAVTHFQNAGLFLEEPTISPDGKFLTYCRNNGGSSLWLLTLTN